MFGIQVSGLNVHQKYLDTTSNNIANANTIGFKYSRAEFADIYSNNVYRSNKTSVGLGAVTTTVAQQFSQGSLSGDTGNSLDMAINGNGFFVLNSDPVTNNYENLTYTRAGAFELDNEGYIVTPQGDYVQFYDVNDEGYVSNLDLHATHSVQVPSSSGAPKASSNLSIGFNLPANADNLGEATNIPAGESAVYNFDRSDSSTYTASTSQTFHDSLGGTHTLTYYFIKDSVDTTNNTTTWDMLVYVDGSPVDLADQPGSEAADFAVGSSSSSDYGTRISGAQLTFDSSGNLVTSSPSAYQLTNTATTQNRTTAQIRTGTEGATLAGYHSIGSAIGASGADTEQVLALTPSFTMYGSSNFTISQTAVDDGYATGLLNNVQTSEDGLLIASYSNGRQIYLGMVAMADFINPQGLTKIGDTQWQASYDSGEANAGQPNVGTMGAIKGSNLEDSNVDLTSQLVNLIIAQRGYQANAQALQTQNTVMDAIMNVR